MSASYTEFDYKLDHFFDGFDINTKVKCMNERSQDWYKKYFTAVMDAGYNLDQRSKNRRSIMEVAIEECKPEIVGALLELDAIVQPDTHVRLDHENCVKVYRMLVHAGFIEEPLKANDSEANSMKQSGDQANGIEKQDDEFMEMARCLNTGDDIAVEIKNFFELTNDHNVLLPAHSADSIGTSQNLLRIQVLRAFKVEDPEIGIAYTPF